MCELVVDGRYMKIFAVQNNETIEYASLELKKYVMGLSRGTIIPKICYVESLPKKPEKYSILLGLLEELSLDRSDLSDPFIEDIIDIDVQECTGYIAGSNPRSILMGVYKYCESAGCRYLRPGKDGDYIPNADITTHSYHFRKKADQPFRGECTEGSVSYEHIRDTVYWLPKIGMNMYMIEGMIPYTYMHKWYGHVGNKKLRRKGQVTDHGMIEEYISLLEQDIKKTGIQLHTLGHGWMFHKFGVRNGPSWMQAANLKEEDKKYLAQVNGKRDLFGGSSFFTHFCYSNQEGRKILVDTLVEYIQQKPYVDFLHVWLADAPNNQCECEECRLMLPSDHYIRLLNELDEALTVIGCKTRIVFIMYVETERPPVKFKLKNPSRFVLLSAIGMNYEKGYAKMEAEPIGEIPEYTVNNYHPASGALRMKWHRDWVKYCDNIVSFVFEYRFYTDMYCDLGHMQISRETYRDMRDLEKVGFQGCVNDQTHRMAMPTTLPRIMMGQTLFDNGLDPEKVTDEYFLGAFGVDGVKCREYLEKLSILLHPSNFRVGGGNGVEEEGIGNAETLQKSWIGNTDVVVDVAQIPSLLESFRPVIEDNIAYATDPARRLSWIYLQYHSSMCEIFAGLLLAGACNDMDMVREKYNELEAYFAEHELEFHEAFDCLLFLRTLCLKLHLPSIPYYD